MTIFLTAPRPIRSVLIANRGEIACRVIATCRRLGLRSVAVFSEADAGARHVRLADAAVCIGPAPAAQSYLNIAAVIAAARAGGVDAIHPGYGFLSENPAFVRACAEAEVIFVGPSAEAVAAMGSKIEARRIAEAAGVPVVPGIAGAGRDDAALAQAARALGYPLLVKASAGGGGRGMRRVAAPEDLPAALAEARAEAGAAFGDATVFIEKLIARPRHIEVQVFGDGEGGAVHLHERDCSIQRNHQKLIEEAPAPNLPDAVRARLFEAALRLTRAIRYGGAGTVEFIVEAGRDQPCFLEMNTRLQVEHPVTEAICGVDLVEWQLRQAAGLPLPLTQDQIRPRGHAIEVRLNAERPEANFLPATGTIAALRVPPGLRLDTGVEAGDTIGSHYDSMLAKVIAFGPDREAARARLEAGLRGAVLAGVGTNLAFLADCLADPAFAAGRATTGFLAETFPDGWQPDSARLLRLRGWAARLLVDAQAADTPFARRDGFRVGGAAGCAPLVVEDSHGASEITLSYGPVPSVRQGNAEEPLGPPPAWHEIAGDAIRVAGDGLQLTLSARPLAEARIAGAGAAEAGGHIRAPLTGRVTEVAVAPGDHVAKGAVLVVMEAMKLVHTLTAPSDAIVRRVNCAAGETLGAKMVLIEMEES